MDFPGPGTGSVVVVDPDPAVARDLEAALADADGEYRVTHVADPTTAEGIGAETDCVVSEYQLPGGDGLSLLAQVRAQADGMPFVLYTDAGGEDVASEAISAGVTDYVLKGDSGIELLANRVVHAIAETRTAERAEQIERINRVLREVDAALVRADDRAEIEQAVCDILADSAQYRMAWIGEYVPEHHRLLPRAHAGVEEGFLDSIPVGPDSTLPDAGPGPRTIETGEVQVTQNVSRDEAFDEYAEAVDERGYRAVATVPIAHESDFYGLLAIYAGRPHAFDDQERRLLESLGEDIGHAINAVSLQDELRQFREAVAHAGHGVCITDPAGVIEHVNEAFIEQTGYDRDGLIGETLSDVQPVGPEDVTGELGSIPDGADWHRELVATRKDGSEYHVEQTIAPIQTEAGDLQGFVAIQADVTERREREDEIRRERDLLEGLFDTSPTGIVVLSPEGDIVRANKRAEEILALEAGEITERTYDEPTWVFTDEDGEELPPEEHPFRRAVETKEPIYDLELRMERSHADPIWVAINGAPLTAPDGTLERLVFTFDDITSIKAAQREIEETNRTLDALIQAAPVGIIAQDTDGEITIWNDGAEEIFGWTAEEAIGLSDPPMVPDEAAEEYQEFFERTLEGESFTGVEIERQRKDGSMVPLHLSAAPIESADGAVTGVMAVFADLSDLKARETQLRQFREAVEHAGHSVMITDVDGVIEYVNPAFEAQTGYAAEEAIGRTPQILNSGTHDAEFFEEMWDTLLTGEVWEREVVNQRKDGSTIYVDQTIAPVFGDDGAIEHFVAVNHDITGRKEKELALERQNQRLEEFASVVSHDLRNPLTVARGHLEFLEGSDEHRGKLADSLDRMANIIEGVLTLAREGEVAETVEPLDIGTLATESWQVVDPPADRLNVAPDLEPVPGDPERTRRILENLCRNAVEHGGDDVRVTVGGLPEGGFYVADDGPGIDPEEREAVFESGYTTAATGTGLGLSIVSRLAEAQGWSVELTESAEGGARFEFRPTDAPLS